MKNSNKEFVNLFFSKLAKLFNHFFPGIVVLELFFNKGFFSSTPEDIYSFVLFLVWSGILSIPFNFIQPLSVDLFGEKLKAYFITSLSSENISDDSEEEIYSAKEAFELGFILIKLLLTYIIYKIIETFELIKSVFSISENITTLIVSVSIATIISYPIGFVYSKLFFQLIKTLIRKAKSLHS